MAPPGRRYAQAQERRDQGRVVVVTRRAILGEPPLTQAEAAGLHGANGRRG